MSSRMKVMVAYDGSSYADSAIENLARAGLPVRADVLVVSVLDLFEPNPTSADSELNSLLSRRVDAFLTTTREHEKRVIEDTTESAAAVVDRLHALSPKQRIRYEILRGDPASELLRKADEWNPDLIVAGTSGRSAIGRFLLGSVSKTLAEKAACSIRIVGNAAANSNEGPAKVVIGARGLNDAERLAEAVSAREWPDGSEALVIMIGDGELADAGAAAELERSAEPLRTSGLTTSVALKSGDPTSVILMQAESSNADSIFIYAGEAGVGRSLDETAAGLVTGAQCPIEIVR